MHCQGSFLSIYLFGCTGSQLWHLESLIFVAAFEIFSFDM